MKSSEYFDKHRHLGWLERIAQEYKDNIALIEVEMDNFTIVGVGYNARSDTRVMNFNPHRTIKAQFILEGLKDALQAIEKEIEDLRQEIASVIVEYESIH